MKQATRNIVGVIMVITLISAGLAILSGLTKSGKTFSQKKVAKINVNSAVMGNGMKEAMALAVEQLSESEYYHVAMPQDGGNGKHVTAYAGN